MAAILSAGPLAAQLQVPATGVSVPPVDEIVGSVADRLGNTVETSERAIAREARRLLRLRDRTLDRVLRQNRDTIDRDINGDLARRGELLATGLTEDGLLQLSAAGFVKLSNEEIEGLGFTVTQLRIPDSLDLSQAQALARSIAPSAEIVADNLHFQAGDNAGAATVLPIAMQAGARSNVEIGVIDGAPGAAVRVIAEKGFAAGAPRPSDHGSAVASLLRSTGAHRIRVADVYGNDPAGGNALAIARAIGWLSASGSKVITISLVGPRNAVVERAIGSARERGAIIVAAVGNDGRASPPAYPASYPGVIAVTGVDRRGRALIEAGRALDLDYAAPGADVFAHDARGRTRKWRGTSFATPLVAARIAAALASGASWRNRLDAEARDLGRRGHDDIYGRGLVCEPCGRAR